MDDCRVLSLLAGCFGNQPYAEASYGISQEHSRRVIAGLSDLADWTNEDHGTTLTANDVAAVLRGAWDDFEASDPWAAYVGA